MLLFSSYIRRVLCAFYRAERKLINDLMLGTSELKHIYLLFCLLCALLLVDNIPTLRSVIIITFISLIMHEQTVENIFLLINYYFVSTLEFTFALTVC